MSQTCEFKGSGSTCTALAEISGKLQRRCASSLSFTQAADAWISLLQAGQASEIPQVDLVLSLQIAFSTS